MKELKTLLTFILLMVGYRYVNSKDFQIELNRTIDSFKKNVNEYEEPIKFDFDFEIDETDLFLDAIGFKESTNRYNVTNRFGYLGKYQFSRVTLKNLGYDISRKEFLNSPEIQEMAMLDLLSHNKEILQPIIDKWEGKMIYGNIITESGILAAAHLAGPSRVKNFFKSGKDFKDGNGTRLSKYLTQFSGYKLNL